jgi:hypothetical protein
MKNKLFLFSTIFLLLFFHPERATTQNIPDFLVNEQVAIDGSEQSMPCISGDENGNYVIAWKDKRNGSHFSIFAQIFINDGTTSGVNFKVSTDSVFTVPYSPAIAVNPNLEFVITWIDRKNASWNIYAQRYSNNGTAIGGNIKVNDDMGDEEKAHPDVSIDSLGNFVIVWADERNGNFDTYAQRFSNNGIALGNNFKINDDNSNAIQYWPKCTSDDIGNFTVCWVDKRNDGDYDIYVQRYLADGTTLGDNEKVNTDPGDAMQLRPDIAIDGDGNYIIGWEDKRSGDWDIYFQRFLSNGSPSGENVLMNDNPEGTFQQGPSISSNLVGDFTICWEDDRNDSKDIYARQYSNEGIPIGDGFKVNSDTTDFFHYYPGITSDGIGNFTIAWSDHLFGFNGDVFAQSYLSDGSPVEDNKKVNDDVGSENQKWPCMAKDSNDNLIYVWVDNRNNQNDIYAQRYSGNGIAIGTNFKVNDDTLNNNTYNPDVAANKEGDFVIVWEDFRDEGCYEIFAQLYSANGTAVGNNFKVNNIGACMHFCPAVVYKPNGDFIIAWADSDEGGLDKDALHYLSNGEKPINEFTNKNKSTEPDVYAQQFSGDGTPIGENFMVNKETGNTTQEYPDIAVDTSGNFIIVWEDKRNGQWEIYLQRYQSDGTPIGDNFKVEDSVYSDYQLRPSITSDGIGNYNVSWRDYRNGNSDIYCRRFLSDGTAIGNSFQVNSDTGNVVQDSPCITAQDNGKFIITWSDMRNGNNDIFAQRYLNNGIPYGDNFQLTENDGLQQKIPSTVLGSDRIYSSWQDNRGGQTGYDIWANILDWDIGVGIDNDPAQELSKMARLHQNVPNPYHTSTEITYSIYEPGFVTLNIFDLQGRKTKSLVNGFQKTGTYSVIVEGNSLTNGIYFYKLEIGEKFTAVKKMVFIQ